MSRIVTITADWKKNDFYFASVYASLLAKVNNVDILTINKDIFPHSISQAAFILRSVYKRFPENTFHLLGVSSIVSKDKKVCIAKHRGQFFVGTDTGIFSLLFSGNPDEFWIIDNQNEFYKESFPELNIFVPIISFLVNGGDINEIASKKQECARAVNFEPNISTEKISAKVIYVDSYGNAITNINENLWKEYVNNNNFECYLSNMNVKITSLSDNYTDVNQGELLMFFNTIGLLEIATREGNISILYDIKKDAEIFIKILPQATSLADL